MWSLRLFIWSAFTIVALALYSNAGLVTFDPLGFFYGQKLPAPASEPSRKITDARAKKIVIPSAGIESKVVFPDSASVSVLKKSLDEGAVHYPGSVLPNYPAGNVFIFGHSSNRTFEKIPARTAFTKLNQTIPGETVELWYEGRVYAYRVARVRILRPNETEIYLATQKRMLTLSTCWPIGDPQNRFIVEAEFVRSYPQPS